MKKRLSILLIITLLLILTMGCTDNKNQENSGISNEEAEELNEKDESSDFRVVTDIDGREIKVPKEINRIIADQWGTADIVISILGEEAADILVAVGNSKGSDLTKAMYADINEKFGEMPNIGGGKGSMDLEKIVSLKPDLYLVENSSRAEETIKSLEKAGIPTVVLAMSEDPMNNPQKAIRLVGELLGREDRSEEVAGFIDKQFDLIRSKNLDKKEEKPTIYLEKGSGTKDEYDVAFTTSGGWGKIVEFAGGKNIIESNEGSSTKIEPEHLINSDPNFIVILGSLGFGTDNNIGTKVLDEYAERKGWENLSAIKNGNFYEISHGQERNQMCFFPSLFLSKLFHPEEFEGVEPLEILEEYYNKYMLLDFNEGTWYIHREG